MLDRPPVLDRSIAATSDHTLLAPNTPAAGSTPDEGEETEAATTPAATGWSPPIDGHGLFKSLMVRLPRRVRRSLDHEQLLALRQAAEEMAWGEHPIDIRLSLPLPRSRPYLVLVGGKERRAGPRRIAERRRHPLVRTGNLASLLVLLCILTGFFAFLGVVLGAVWPG